MKIPKTSLIAVAICAIAFVSSRAQAQIIDSFDGGFHRTWNTDRTDPYIFMTMADPFAATDGGGHGDVLKLGISSDMQQSGFVDYQHIGFYNTQGKQSAMAITGNWNIASQLYMTQAMIQGAYTYRTDLWARNSATGLEADASYGIIGVSDVLGSGPSFEVWTSGNQYIAVGGPLSTEGWYTLGMDYIAGTGLEYLVNGSVVYTDAGFTDPAALTTVYYQGANLPPPSNPSGDHRENYYWDGAEPTVPQTPVPEPSTYGLMGAVGLLGLVALRRKKTKAAVVAAQTSSS